MRAVLALVCVSACSTVGDRGDAATTPPPGGSDTEAPPPVVPPSTAAPLPRIAPPFDPASTATMLDEWPRIVPGVHARGTTSFDRSGGNEDGFGGTYSVRYVDADGQNVIFDERGPGVLRTLWFTSAVDGASPLGLGPVRFWFDDEPRPRLEIDADALFAGATAPFLAPLVASNDTSTGGFASWAPLPFKSRLRITMARRPGFVQLHHDALPADWDVPSYAGTVDTKTRERFLAGTSTLPLEELAERTGAGTVDVLRFVPDAPADDAALAGARIAITFDGTKTVDVPLALFFGSGRGLAPVRSVAWTMEPSLFESRLPMPYWASMKAEVTGLAGKLFTHASPNRWTRADAGYLEVHTSAETTVIGRDFVYADVTGTGKIVATVLGIDPVSPALKQWWEGDLRSRTDDARSPALHGTGHEDDHLGGWSNEFLLGPFSLPMQGAPRTDILDANPNVQINGQTTLYRLWSGIPFYRSVRHTTEHGTGNGRAAVYAAATFLYRQPKPRLVKTDAFEPAEPGDALTTAFEGEDPTTVTAIAHRLGVSTFELAVDPANVGVELRRWFDRNEAPSQAYLEVEDVLVADVRTFGPVAENRRWVEEDVFVPPQLTRGKSRLAVRWVSAKTTTAVRFEAWSVLGGE